MMQDASADVVLVSRQTVAELTRQLAEARALVEILSSWLETAEVIEDDDLMARIQRGMEDVAQSRGVTFYGYKSGGRE